MSASAASIPAAPRERLRINLGLLLERRARVYAERPFVTLAESGETLSYAGFNRLANRVAHGLAALGVGAGEHVAVMLPNGFEFLATSYALKKLGAVEVAVNRTFRGPALERMLGLTRPAVVVAAAEDLAVLAGAAHELAGSARLVVVGDPGEAARGWPGPRIVAFADMMSGCDEDLAPATPDTDTAMVLFTSGTTGVSKGCMLPHRAAIRAAESIVAAFDLGEGDCVYTPYPLFHVGAAHYDVLTALVAGARVVMRNGFSVSAFWPDVARYGATWFMALGSVQQLLWAAPHCIEERAHGLRILWGTPLPVDPAQFEARFGVHVARGGGYGSTDAGSVAMPILDAPGGRVLDNYEVAIGDENDDLLPPGAVGELLVRPREPAIMSSGYFGMPDATVVSRRNLWFHTGDLARLDEAGNLHFVCRMTERIRVLGEMVSAYEVEEVILTHPSVEDCAVIGVPGEHGEEDVKAFVTLRIGAAPLDAEALREFCRPRMSRYMVPRHVAFIAEMPRTPSGKPAKSELAALAAG